MSNRYNVVHVGLGAIGRLISKQLIERQNIHLEGVIDINPDLVNRKLADILGVQTNSNIVVESNLQDVLTRNQVDVVTISTSSSLRSVSSTVLEGIKAGCNIISICEELSYPFEDFPEISTEIDDFAKANNVSVVGTGINPGYLMDLLPIVLTAPCQKVDKVTVTRMMNSARRREPFQEKIGTGLSEDEFQQKISNKEITGHVGLTQSIQMIVVALGMSYDEIVEFPPKAVLAEQDITTAYCFIPRGHVCGLQSKAVARKNQTDLIVLDFTAYAGEHEEFDKVVIEGIPRISNRIEGGVHGDLGTVAMVVNLIPKICVANAGLLTMKDLPVPCNTEGILKD